MREINTDGTLKGYEFSKGYDPRDDDTPAYTHQEGDMIDFSCSPDWVGYFANQGMTTDYPPSFYLDKNGPLTTSTENEEESRKLQPTEVTRLFTGRYTELPAIGKMSARIGRLEEDIKKLKGRRGDDYTIIL